MFYTYILRSKGDGKLYTGFTNDLRKRIKEHNSGLSQSTQSRAPFEIVYYEAHNNKEDALAREKFLKTGWGRQYIKKVLRNYFNSTRR